MNLRPLQFDGLGSVPNTAEAEARLRGELEGLHLSFNGGTATVLALDDPHLLQALLLANLLRKNDELRIKSLQMTNGALKCSRYLRRETRFGRGRAGGAQQRAGDTTESAEERDHSWAAYRILRKRNPGALIHPAGGRLSNGWLVPDEREGIIVGPVTEVVALTAIVTLELRALVVLHPQPTQPTEALNEPDRIWNMTVVEVADVGRGVLKQCFGRPNPDIAKAVSDLQGGGAL